MDKSLEVSVNRLRSVAQMEKGPLCAKNVSSRFHDISNKDRNLTNIDRRMERGTKDILKPAEVLEKPPRKCSNIVDDDDDLYYQNNNNRNSHGIPSGDYHDSFEYDRNTARYRLDREMDINDYSINAESGLRRNSSGRDMTEYSRNLSKYGDDDTDLYSSGLHGYNRAIRGTEYVQSPARARMSAEIIKEARDSLAHPYLRCLSTTRPETPREDQRRLFRQSSANDLISRPPSTLSMGPHVFESESRPCSGTRLSPLDHRRGSAIFEGSVRSDLAPRPPLGRDSSRSGSKKANSRSRPPPVPPLTPGALKTSTSMGYRHKTHMLRSESLNDVSGRSSIAEGQPLSPPDSARRVHSGPTTRGSVPSAEGPLQSSHNQHLNQISSSSSSSQGPECNKDSQPASSQHCVQGRIRSVQGDESHHGTLGGGEARSSKVKSSGIKTAADNKDSRTKPEKSSDLIGKEKAKNRNESGKNESNQSETDYCKTANTSNQSEKDRSKRTNKAIQSQQGDGKQINDADQSSRRDRSTSKQRQEGERRDVGGQGGGEGDGHWAEEYYQTMIQPILEEMSHASTATNTSRLIQLTDDLHEVLERENLLGRNCVQRPIILKALFKLLSNDCPQLTIKLSRTILELNMTSTNNLLKVCKLICALSKDNSNDQYFIDNHLTGLLIETACFINQTGLSSTLALVYCLGAIKCLSSNTIILKELATSQNISKFSQLLSLSQNDSGSLTKEQMEALQQLTVVLRNISDVSGARSYFLQLGVLEQLCKLINICLEDSELLLNIFRILNRLTIHADVCTALMKVQKNFKSYIQILQKHREREELALRISFVLGNLTAKHQEARILLLEADKSFNTLISLLSCYYDKDTGHKTKRTTTEDVLVKTIRLIANVAISEETGEHLACNDECLQLLIKILEVKNLEQREELVVNTMATINNLSFYNVKSSCVIRRRLDIAKLALKFFEVKHPDSLLESTRVFGNLSRERDVRDFLVDNNIDEAMVALLDSENPELVYTACGVLINLTTDVDKRAALRKYDGISKLVDVLRDMGCSDWQLASLVCQTLWNFSGNISNTGSNACFGEQCVIRLIQLLQDYLDDGRGDSGLGGEMEEFSRAAWRNEFCPVANDLLNRIKANLSQFEPLTRNH